MKTRFVSAIFLFIGFYLIVSFSRDLWFLVQKEGEIQKSNLRLEKLELENEQLKHQGQIVQSPEFIEKEAREKLGFTKEGETVLILPENLREKMGFNQPQVSSQEIPNWEKWRRLFF